MSVLAGGFSRGPKLTMAEYRNTERVRARRDASGWRLWRARQEVAKLLLHEGRQSLAITPARRLRAERLEVIAHQAVQGFLVGPAWSIDSGGGRPRR